MSWSITAASAAGFATNAENVKQYQTEKVKSVIDATVAYANAFSALCPEDKVPYLESSGHIEANYGYAKTDFKYVTK